MPAGATNTAVASASPEAWRFQRDPARLIARKPIHCHAASGLVLVINVGECLTLSIPNAEAFGGLVDLPGRRECAVLRHAD
jgi:hypothetical protein